MSLRVFRSKLVKSRAQTVVQSDCLAALSVAVKLSSLKVLMKAREGEMSVVLDELESELIVQKFEADALSRMSQRGANHGLLVSATRLPVPTGNDAFYNAC